MVDYFSKNKKQGSLFFLICLIFLNFVYYFWEKGAEKQLTEAGQVNKTQLETIITTRSLEPKPNNMTNLHAQSR